MHLTLPEAFALLGEFHTSYRNEFREKWVRLVSRFFPRGKYRNFGKILKENEKHSSSRLTLRIPGSQKVVYRIVLRTSSIVSRVTALGRTHTHGRVTMYDLNFVSRRFFCSSSSSSSSSSPSFPSSGNLYERYQRLFEAGACAQLSVVTNATTACEIKGTLSLRWPLLQNDTRYQVLHIYVGCIPRKHIIE